MQAERNARRVKLLVAQTKAIRWWIDRQIEHGRSDEEIEAELPIAAAFIIGEIGLEDLVQARAMRDDT